jgi:endoglucanase
LVNKNIRYTIIQTGLLLLLLTVITSVAKSRPIRQQARAIAFKRAKSLNNGISISWLEQT